MQKARFQTGTNLLTCLRNLERAEGYQVGQQARMNMNLFPPYGIAVEGVRLHDTDNLETVPRVFQAFVQFVGKRLKRQGATRSTALLDAGGNKKDFVGRCLLRQYKCFTQKQI